MPAGRAGVTARVRYRVLRSTDRFWRPADFDDPPEAVAQALHRLRASGELLHVRRGLYWRGTRTLLGMAPPPAESLVKAIAIGRGAGPADVSAANMLGLSTQIPRRPTFAVPTRVPESLPEAVKMVSRTGCRNRVRSNVTPAEVALLEVLRNWGALVEVDDAEASRVIKSHFASGALRPRPLASAAGTEPPRVRMRLAAMLASCGFGQDAAMVIGTMRTHARMPA